MAKTVVSDDSGPGHARWHEDTLWRVSHDLLASADRSGNLTRLSAGWVAILGVETDTLLSCPIHDLASPDDRAAFAAAVEQARQGAQDVSCRARIRGANGIERLLDWRLACDGERIVGAAQDITELAAAQARVDLLQSVLDSLKLGLYVWELADPADDLSLRAIVANAAAASFSGVESSIVLGRKISETFPGMADSPLPRIYADVARTGREHDLGEVRYGDERVKESIFSALGSPLPGRRMLLQFENISERRLVAEQARRSEALLRAVLDNSPTLTFVKDLEGRFVLVNRRMAEVVGRSEAELLGQAGYPYFTPETAAPLLAADQQVLSMGATVESEETHPHADGPRAYLSLRFPVRDHAGAVAGICGIATDISDRKRTEQLVLQEQVIAAQEATLRALSTPLMPIAAGVLAMPLIGPVDTRRAQEIMAALLDGIVTQRARTAIIDVTGIHTVDTHAASALLRTAAAARLLGTEVILTGIHPEVAQTLVGLGLDLAGVLTLADLQSGIAHALRRRS